MFILATSLYVCVAGSGSVSAFLLHVLPAFPIYFLICRNFSSKATKNTLDAVKPEAGLCSDVFKAKNDQKSDV